MSFGFLRAFAALLLCAVLGGAAALGGAALLGGFDGETTVVTETAAPSPALAPSGAGMTLNEIYQRAAPGVVRVNASSNSTAVGQGSALGSGFVIDKTGHIVTNYHVVEGGDKITVSFSNRDSVSAEIV